MSHKRRTIKPTVVGDPEQMPAFVGGRARHNHRRQFAATQRRKTVLARMLEFDGFGPRGWQSRLAEELGVSRATISSDISALHEEYWQRRKARRRGSPK